MKKFFFLICFFICGGSTFCWAQKDSTAKQKTEDKTLFQSDDAHSYDSIRVADSTTSTQKIYNSNSILNGIVKQDSSMTAETKHNPKKATMRSLMIPGWGQIYNKQYWKVPIVWGALGTTAGIFFWNKSEYNKAKFAFSALYDAYVKTPASERDASRVEKMDSYYLNIWNNKIGSSSGESLTTAANNILPAIASSRNYYRRNMDYSIMWFFILWGVNIADATVFGHLKDFDVSPDLSMNIRPTFMPLNKAPGIALTFNFK